MKQYRYRDMTNHGGTVHIFRYKVGSLCPVHSHDFIELVYILHGEAEEYVNDACYHVKRGDLVFINYGGTHRFVAPQGFEYINICFHPEALDGQMITTDNAFGLLQLAAFDELRRENDGGMISFRGAEREEIERLLFLMQEEYRRRDAEWQTAMKSYMNVLFVRMLRKTASVGGDDEREDLWEDLLRYIEENLGEDLSLVSLAQRCFYNPSYFSRAFKDRFHMPLTEYVARRKLAHAVELVKDKGVTVTQAAVSSGFSSSGSLYRAALRWTGKRFSDLCR